MTRASLTLPLFLVCIGSPRALAQAPEHTECDAARPGVLDARLTVALGKTASGEYRYDYFIFNPATSTGCLYGVGLDVSDTRPAGNVVALPPLFRIDDHGGYPVEGHYSGALLPDAHGLLGGRGGVAWSYHSKPDRATHQFHDSDVIHPGDTLYVLSVVTPNPPVFRNYTLYTYWRQTGTDTPFALESDVDVLGRVLGPGTGPCFPDTDGDGVCDDVDNCPTFPNLEQLDADEDGVGDICADGVFDGGGQRPRDVNKFLTYARPLAARTELPAGSTQTVVTVAYGEIRAASFTADLEGADVRGLFHPRARTAESVTIPVHPGSNVLKLSVQGITSADRDATDSDRLVFLVP